MSSLKFRSFSSKAGLQTLTLLRFRRSPLVTASLRPPTSVHMSEVDNVYDPLYSFRGETGAPEALPRRHLCLRTSCKAALRAHFQAPGIPTRRQERWTSAGSRSWTHLRSATEEEADTTASALLLKHSSIGGADDVTLEVLLSPPDYAGTCLVRSNSQPAQLCGGHGLTW